jgi:ribosome biogenesis GTPase
MSPKFSGGSDAWLDDEGRHSAPQPGRRKKKAAHEKTVEFPLDQANATVIEVYPNQCRVILDGSVKTLLCPYRRNGVRKQIDIRERTFVAVGDRVVISETGKDAGQESGIVEGVCHRSNMLCRPAPGRDEGGLRHVIGANMDRVVIVVSATNPEFSPGLVDRFLVAIQSAGIDPVLCITKIDLVESSYESPWSVYSRIGFAVFEVSNKTGFGVDALREKIEGQKVLFCGQSGVGKTSLLRMLLGVEIGKVSDVSLVTGKGKHTTTSTVLLNGPKGAQWLDSPGMSEFGLVDVKPEELASYYPEFIGLDCYQIGCHHVGEEACKAENHQRHTGYVRIFQSLKAGRH